MLHRNVNWGVQVLRFFTFRIRGQLGCVPFYLFVFSGEVWVAMVNGSVWSREGGMSGDCGDTNKDERYNTFQLGN